MFKLVQLVSAVLVACAFCSAGVQAQDQATEEPTAAEDSAPEADGGVAEEPSEDEDESWQTVLEARQRARELFYTAELRFDDIKQTSIREWSEHFGYGRAQELAAQKSLDKQAVPLDLILVDPEKGLFVTADPNVNFANVVGLDLIADDGNRVPLQRVAIGRTSGALLLQAEGFSVDVAGPVFRPDAVADGARMFSAITTSFDEYEDVQVRGLRLNSFLSANDGSVDVFNLGGLAPNLTTSWPVANYIMFDEAGAFAGIAVSQLLIRQGERRNWVYRWNREEDWVSLRDLSTAARGAVQIAMRHTHQVLLRIQGEARGNQPVAPQILRVYGLAVGPNRLFIAGTLNRQSLERVEDVFVEMPDGSIVPATFEGQYESFGGIIIGTTAALPVPDGLFQSRDIADMELFFDVSVKQRLGRKDPLIKYNRFMGTEKGYKDRVYRSYVRPISSGSLVMDMDGRFCGFVTQEQRYESVVKTLQSGRDYNSRFYTFTEMREYFDSPEPYFDPTMRVKDVEQRKELAWLGVEYQPVTPRLATQLGISKETRDGALGLIVNLVYPDSPAEHLGLAAGDVLLRLVELDKTGEYALRDTTRRETAQVSTREGLDAYIDWRWFQRKNYLTNLLTGIGVGTQVQLTYSRAGEEKTVPLQVEKAPPDLLSAKKYKSESAGLTVKDITYEVRTILRLGDSLEGVVVYEVEPGSPGSLARIRPMDFIVDVAGSPVRNVDEFKSAMENLAGEGRRSVTVGIRNLDEARITEIQFEQPGVEDAVD